MSSNCRSRKSCMARGRARYEVKQLNKGLRIRCIRLTDCEYIWFMKLRNLTRLIFKDDNENDYVIDADIEKKIFKFIKREKSNED